MQKVRDTVRNLAAMIVVGVMVWLAWLDLGEGYRRRAAKWIESRL